MAGTVQWLRSVLFIAQMYLAMPLFAIVFTPFALFSRPAAFAACHAYCRWVRWTARWMVGLRSEVRGTPPQGEALIAAKHHSFFDIILLFSALPRAKFIMKKELKWAPILGWYALRIGCVPVDRGKRGQAITAMMQAVQDGRQDPGQLIIYPEGTRTAPVRPRPIKWGLPCFTPSLGRIACLRPPMWACSGRATDFTASPALRWWNFCRRSRRGCRMTVSWRNWNGALKPRQMP